MHCNEFGFCIDGAETFTAEEPNVVIRCFNDGDKECPSTHHCNEMHYCVAGAHDHHDQANNEAEDTDDDDEPVFIKCKKNEACAIAYNSPNFHCNEFHNCIPGAPFVPPSLASTEGEDSDDDDEPVLVKCKTHQECFAAYDSSDFHCNEFHNCIPGAPYMPSQVPADCKDDSDCPYSMHCIAEKKLCVPHGLKSEKAPKKHRREHFFH